MGIDYISLTDTELEAMRTAVATEQERRVVCSRNPGEIKRLTNQYLTAGGDPACLPAAQEPEEATE